LANKQGNSLQQLALPRSILSWNLTSLRVKPVEIESKVLPHAKHIDFHLTEVAMPSTPFATRLERIVPSRG
jgi:hypothetical protein